MIDLLGRPFAFHIGMWHTRTYSGPWLDGFLGQLSIRTAFNSAAFDLG